MNNDFNALGANLGALSGGRTMIMSICVAYFTISITIAVRYSATRKQFGINKEELPVIEYQLQQWRLFPYIAVLYAFKIFSDFFSLQSATFQLKKFLGEKNLVGNYAQRSLIVITNQ